MAPLLHRAAIMKCTYYLLKASDLQKAVPCVGLGQPLPLIHSLPHLLLSFSSPFLLFLFALSSFLFFSIPSLSTRIVPLHFQAGGHGT